MGWINFGFFIIFMFFSSLLCIVFGFGLYVLMCVFFGGNCVIMVWLCFVLVNFCEVLVMLYFNDCFNILLIIWYGLMVYWCWVNCWCGLYICIDILVVYFNVIIIWMYIEYIVNEIFEFFEEWYYFVCGCWGV